MVALTCRWPLLSLLYASPPPAQVSVYHTPPRVWPLHTQLNLPLKVEMDPELVACANRSEGQRHMGGGQVKHRFWAYVRALWGNFNNINLLIKKQNLNLKSKNHSWNKLLKMNNKISLLLLYFNGLSPPDSQRNTSETKWFAVIVSCSMNIHNGVCI